MKLLLVTAFVALASLQAGAADDSILALRKVRESFVNTALVSYPPSEEVAARFLEYSDRGRASIDVLLMQLYLSVQLPPDEVGRVVSLFDYGKGQWNDIDYSNMQRGEWDMTLHITRIYALARAYRCPESQYYGSEELGRLIHRASQWWFDNRPVNPNWWHNDIGVPKKLAAAMLLIRDELSRDEMDGILYVLERSKFGRTGQNKAWLAGNQLMKALLVEDPDLAAEAVRQIEEEIAVSSGEGIQDDWSFHQHGAQMQFGNYGLAFAEGTSFWARVLAGTDYAFDDGRVEILENFILNGLCQTVWRGIMDPSACGRQLVCGRGKAYACAVTMLNMAALDRPRSGIFRRMALQTFQPELYANELVGARYFPRSDFGVFRTRAWYASMRMHSERTVGYEFTNAENRLAQFSADGAMLLMQSGREYEDIFPYWDWRKLPGVTAYEDGKALDTRDRQADKMNNSSHVGALQLEDAMLTTMELERFGLHAFKSSFFFPDIVVSLGSDIRRERSDISRITTALDQNHLSGKVASGKAKSRFQQRQAAWVHHCGRGYVSLDGAEMTVETGIQRGNWKYMTPAYERPDSGMVFKCYLEHDPDSVGSYAYAVLPCSSASSVKSFARRYVAGKSRLEVLCNDAFCQAISYCGNIYAVIHKAGEYCLAGTSRLFDAPGIYLLSDGETRFQPLPPSAPAACNA